ncbi:hypothetical protein NC653_019956 [Populus alba x Populus x berolinensis]|uniref:Secreted protein n=1 Tax=Populus alba x Populus x berolinensis TaxID=444605 RepID=A0AAD6QBS2_9ROSI|nr:hypothetical protein NC653_019956 [Populus alba x Populus x berolinensis]
MSHSSIHVSEVLGLLPLLVLLRRACLQAQTLSPSSMPSSGAIAYNHFKPMPRLIQPGEAPSKNQQHPF